MAEKLPTPQYPAQPQGLFRSIRGGVFVFLSSLWQSRRKKLTLDTVPGELLKDVLADGVTRNLEEHRRQAQHRTLLDR